MRSTEMTNAIYAWIEEAAFNLCDHLSRGRGWYCSGWTAGTILVSVCFKAHRNSIFARHSLWLIENHRTYLTNSFGYEPISFSTMD